MATAPFKKSAIGEAPLTVTTSPGSHSHRRSTISAQPEPLASSLLKARAKMSSNYQCTHLTMTRLYNKDLRCSICLRPGSMGWLYRCTQDRELMLEDDIELGCEENLDQLADIFGRPTAPKRRGPVARMDKLAAFDEMSDEQLKQYSREQLKTILNQRAHVLEVANERNHAPSRNDISALHSNPGLKQALEGPDRSLLDLDPSMQVSVRPWSCIQKTNKNNKLTQRGGECQFKCCGYCRPSLRDRSFLSIDAIVNGEIPATATTGFGFHLLGARPVAPAHIVRNLGLRPNPPLRSSRRPDTPFPTGTPTPSPEAEAVSAKFPHRAAATLGLGLEISTLPKEDPTTCVASPIPLPVSPNAIFIDNDALDNDPKPSKYSPRHQAMLRGFPLLNTIVPTQRRHSISVPSTTSGASLEAAYHEPLPEQTREEWKLLTQF